MNFRKSKFFIAVIILIFTAGVFLAEKNYLHAIEDSNTSRISKIPVSATRLSQSRRREPLARGQKANLPQSFDSLMSLLKEKPNLSSDEYQKNIQLICFRIKSEGIGAIEAALLNLPPGDDSRGAFNSLTFYLMELSPAEAINYLIDLGDQKMYPADWLSDAAESGLGSLASTAPNEALDLALNSQSIFNSAHKLSKIVSDIINRTAREDQKYLYDDIKSRLDQEAISLLAEKKNYCRLVLESRDFDVIKKMVSASSGAVNFNKFGEAAADMVTFSDGYKALDESGLSSTAALKSFYAQWFNRDVNLAASNINMISDQALRNQIIIENIAKIQTWDANAALDWANSLSNKKDRENALKTIGR